MLMFIRKFRNGPGTDGIFRDEREHLLVASHAIKESHPFETRQRKATSSYPIEASTAYDRTAHHTQLLVPLESHRRQTKQGNDQSR